MFARLWGSSDANKQADATIEDEFGDKAGLGGFGGTSTTAVHEDFLVGSSDPRNSPKRVSSNAKPLSLQDDVEVDNDTDDDIVCISPTRNSSNPLPLSKDFEDMFDSMDDDNDDVNSIQDSVTVGSSDPDSTKWRNKHLSNFLTDFATSSADAADMLPLPDDAMAAALAQAAQELDDDDDWSQVSELSTLSSRQRKQQQQEIIDKANAAAAITQVQSIPEEEESSSGEESEPKEEEEEEEHIFESKSEFAGSSDSDGFGSVKDASASNDAFATNEAFEQEQNHDAFSSSDAFADHQVFGKKQQEDDPFALNGAFADSDAFSQQQEDYPFASNDAFADSHACRQQQDDDACRQQQDDDAFSSSEIVADGDAFRQQQDDDAFSSNDAFAESGSALETQHDEEDGEESSSTNSIESEENASLSRQSESLEQNSHSQEEDEDDHDESSHLDDASYESEEFEKPLNTNSYVFSQGSSHSYSSHSNSSVSAASEHSGPQHEAPSHVDDLSEQSSSEFEEDGPSEYGNDSEQSESGCDQNDSDNFVTQQTEPEFDMTNDFHEKIASQCSSHSDDEDDTQQGSEHSVSSQSQSSENKESNHSYLLAEKQPEFDMTNDYHEAEIASQCSSHSDADSYEDDTKQGSEHSTSSQSPSSEDKESDHSYLHAEEDAFPRDESARLEGDDDASGPQQDTKEIQYSESLDDKEVVKPMIEDVDAEALFNDNEEAVEEPVAAGRANLELAKQLLEEEDIVSETGPQPKAISGQTDRKQAKLLLEDESDKEEDNMPEALQWNEPKSFFGEASLKLAKQLLEDNSEKEEDVEAEPQKQPKSVGGGSNLDLAQQLLEANSEEQEDALLELERTKEPKSVDGAVNLALAKQLLEEELDDEDASSEVQSREQLLEDDSLDDSKEVADEESYPKGDDVSSMHDDDVFVPTNSPSQLLNDAGGTFDIAERVEISESEESESCSDESDSDEDSDDGGDGKPFKLVVKEAPLLRLENVTSQTRSNIVPVKKNTNKGAGWGWFGFGGKKEETSQSKIPSPVAFQPEVAASKASEPESVETPKDERKPEPDVEKQKNEPASESSTLSMSNARTTLINAKEKKEKNGVSPESATAQPAEESSKIAVENENAFEADSSQKKGGPPPLLESKSSHSVSSGRSQAVSGKQGTGTQMDESTADSSRSLSPGASDPVASPIASPCKSSSCETTSLTDEVPLLQSPSPSVKSGSLAQGSTGSPRKSPSKRKKKKKKDALTMHLGKARKVGRHGDEISVGTTRVQTRSAGTAQHIVLAAGANMFADVGDIGEKIRPWEGNLSSRKKKKKERKNFVATSKLGVFGSIAEEGDVLEELESLKTSEHLFREDGPSIDHNTLGTLLESADEDTADNLTFTEDALSSQGGEESIATEREPPQEEDGLAELMAISKLESKLEADVDEVDFDDMWDTVSCDASTALEFVKKKRKKNKEKERRRLQREKEKEENLTATQRLRLFEKEKKDIDENSEAKKVRKRRKQTRMKLSTEFKTAINKLFDDDRSVISQLNSGTSANEKEKVVDIPRGIQLLKQNSVKSLYLVKEGDKDEQSKAPEASVSGDSDDESGSYCDNVDEEKDPKAAVVVDTRSVKSSGSRRSRGTRLNDVVSVANSLTSSSKSMPAKSAKLDPAEVFEREMKRAQGAKFLSIASLRQEMNDRRGTSVALVKKEYDNYLKRMKCAGAEEIDFGDLHGNNAIQFGASFDKADPFLSPKKVKLASNEEPEEGLERYMSRWGASDGVTELDDLNTVMMLSPNTPQTMTGMVQGMTSGLSAGLGSLPNMPALSDMPKPSDVQKAIISRKPSPKKKNSGTEEGGGHAGDFSFPTAFGDAPLAPIVEQSDDEDEDDARGLFSKGAPRFDESDEDDEVKSVRSVRSSASRRTVSTFKLGSFKKFVPKLKRDTNGRGMHRMDLLGDNDERGLLG